MHADVGNGATSGQYLGAAERKVGFKEIAAGSMMSRCAKAKEKGRQAIARLLDNCR